MQYRPLKEQVYDLLEKRDWRLYDLAAELEVSNGRMSHVMNDEGRVGAEVIERIADALKVPPEHFDLYVLRKLAELAVSAPELIQVGRKLLAAKDDRQFKRISSQIG